MFSFVVYYKNSLTGDRIPSSLLVAVGFFLINVEIGSTLKGGVLTVLAFFVSALLFFTPPFVLAVFSVCFRHLVSIYTVWIQKVKPQL